MYPMQTIFHWLTLGFVLGIKGLCWALGGHVGSVGVSGYLDVGIGNAKAFGSGVCLNPKGFALQWNIGLNPWLVKP